MFFFFRSTRLALTNHFVQNALDFHIFNKHSADLRINVNTKYSTLLLKPNVRENSRCRRTKGSSSDVLFGFSRCLETTLLYQFALQRRICTQLMPHSLNYLEWLSAYDRGVASVCKQHRSAMRCKRQLPTTRVFIHTVDAGEHCSIAVLFRNSKLFRYKPRLF